MHAPIPHMRQDWLHETSTRVVRELPLMSVEDLNVRGLLANHRLGRKIAGMGFYTADSWSTKRSGTARSSS